jgi:hypothetical protein
MVPMEAGGEFRLCRVDKIAGNEVTSKRRKGLPSETQVKRGTRVVGGCKELSGRLGRNDPCPCLSGLGLKNCCMRSSDRHHFFQRLRRHLSFVVSDCQDELANAAIGSTYTVAAFCCLRSRKRTVPMGGFGSLSAVASNWEGNGGFAKWRTTIDQPECTDRRDRGPWNKGDEFSGYNAAQASTPEAFPRRVDSSLLRYLRKPAKH